MVSNIIEAELGYLFTNDYEYLMNRTNLVPVQFFLKKLKK